MKGILKILAFGVLYAITAAGTGMFLFTPPEPEEDATEANAEEEILPGPAPVAVALRPDSSASIEAIVQMSESIRRTEQDLAEREKTIAQEEERLSMLFQDLATEREELKAFSKSLDTKLQALGDASDNLRLLLDEIKQNQEKLDTLAKQTGTDDQSVAEELENRVNDVKSWFENLEPTQAAEYLREFSNNGKLEFAAALLQKLPDRTKSKILGAMNDPALVEQLIDALSLPSP